MEIARGLGSKERREQRVDEKERRKREKKKRNNESGERNFRVKKEERKY